MSKLSEREYLATQYRDSANLDARVRIYKLYATNPVSWMAWQFEQLALAAAEQVIDLGCGPGNLWRENASRLPADLRLTLSDRSEGMVAEARERLAGFPSAIDFRCFDMQAIPFPDHSFDVALCSHVLYHVPDRAKALAEVHRVLKPGGRFYAGTNDQTHILEIRELVQRFGLETSLIAAEPQPGFFDLEAAMQELGACFSRTDLRRRSDELRVTDAAPLVDYVRSMANSDHDESVLAELGRHVAQRIAQDGAFVVRVSAGLVEGVRAPEPA